MAALWMMAAGGIASSLGAASSAKSQSQLQIAQWREAELNRTKDWANQSFFQILENGEKWERNRVIGQEALKVREQNKFWGDVRHNNTMSQLSKGMSKSYENLTAQLTTKLGGNSATSRAMLRNSMDNYFRARDTINLNKALKDEMVDADYQRALNMRDFGFTKYSEITPGQYMGSDPSTAYNNALIQGLGSTAMSVGGAAYMQGSGTDASAPAQQGAGGLYDV
tara:strand:+ start:712 stop:1383 length:672 start_codon:yes stop_codon:yes gene_type:complete